MPPSLNTKLPLQKNKNDNDDDDDDENITGKEEVLFKRRRGSEQEEVRLVQVYSPFWFLNSVAWPGTPPPPQMKLAEGSSAPGSGPATLT